MCRCFRIELKLATIVSMRLFLLSILAAWTAGIVLGVLAASVFIIALAAVACLTLMWRRFSFPVVVASCLLLVLSYLWVRGTPAAGSCQLPPEVDGIIQRIHRLEERRAQYVVKDSQGCTVLVITNRFPQYHPGNRIRAQGSVQSLENIPGEYTGYAEYLARQDIDGTLRYPVISLLADDTVWYEEIRSGLRGQIEQVFLEPEAGIVQGMVLAEAGTIPETVQDNFRRTGVSHILAISGFNITLLTGMAFVVAMLLPLSPAIRTAGLIIFLWAYIILIGWPVSAVRAAIFLTILLIGYQLRLLINLPTVVMLTVAAYATFDPATIKDVGFQLSLAAVVGIALMLFLGPGKRPAKSWAGRRWWIIAGLFTTLGATLTTWPITAYHFQSALIIGLAANFFVVPAASALLILSLLTLLLSLLAPATALAGAFAVHAVWRWIDAVTYAFALIPGVYYENVRLAGWFIPLYFAGLAALSAIVLKMQRRSWREIWE